MFDPITSSLLRSAPAVPGLDPNNIPQLITRHYAALTSARLRGSAETDTGIDDGGWSLERIADTYELITSIEANEGARRASAFVAATAHQVLSRRPATDIAASPTWSVTREAVDPSIAAALLFLAAEQYADAHEAAAGIRLAEGGMLYEARILTEHVRDLARGQLQSMVERAGRWRRAESPNFTIQTRALVALLEALITGVEILAADMLSLPSPSPSAGRFNTAREAFLRVFELSSNSYSDFADALDGDLLTIYGGPRHLAALLLAAERGMRHAALAKLPPPDGSDKAFWQSWLRYRAANFPFIWPNHRDAIGAQFHQTGKSAVVVLPTGAGKTTISSLKIAGTLARKKKVVFLAPTHALVEQLTNDLQQMFPKDLLGSVVSSDFDMLLIANTQLQEIEVMTPEGCLAMLSFAPEAFSEVGLLVFDECHLLSPQSGKIRRALDGMLCLLAFNRFVPDADMLFLSAMLKNGKEFSAWIGNLTGRDCIDVDLLWKPSRQARGVVIYKEEDLTAIKSKAIFVQSEIDKKEKKKAKALRAAAKKELVVQPMAIWGLQHNWLATNRAYCSFTPISDAPVALSGDIKNGPLRLLPNANQVAAKLAVTAARNGLKTIVFVNTKADAVSTADDISTQLGEAIEPTELEADRWDALRAELGDLRHSILSESAAAVPHNSAMLRLERDLAESLFKRLNGAKVIVATPTLAQGLNLPAQLAILAGDKRANLKGGRESLEAHEILNAAARAGRAGHLANGIVLLVPEPIISYPQNRRLGNAVVDKLRSVLPEDDRCVIISDPLEIVLDRLMEGKLVDPDVRYTINRMAMLRESGAAEEPTALFDLKRSLGAFVAKQKAKYEEFDSKLAALKSAIDRDATTQQLSQTIYALASQSGLPADLLQELYATIEKQVGALPTTVEAWLLWVVDWLAANERARELLLLDVSSAIAAASGKKKSEKTTPAMLKALLPGLGAWITGKPLRDIESMLGGEPGSESDTLRICPRARELVSIVIPRGLSFIMGLLSRIVEDIDPFDRQEDLSPDLVQCLSSAVRRGYDGADKIAFASENKPLLSRVQVHAAWAAQNISAA